MMAQFRHGLLLIYLTFLFITFSEKEISFSLEKRLKLKALPLTMPNEKLVIHPDRETLGPTIPGPDRYQLPPLVGREHHDLRRPTQPAFSIKSRRAPEKVVVTPAPIGYNTENITRYGNVTTGRTLPALKGRTHPKLPPQTPGPLNYNIATADKVKFTQHPGVKLGGRISKMRPTGVPGPNKYALPPIIDGTGHIPNMTGSPAFKLSGKWPQINKNFGPGPNKYGAVAPEKFLPNYAPTPKLLGRYTERIKSDGPGPNRYDGRVDPLGKCGPKFSLGLKHNPRASILRTTDDIKYAARGYLSCDFGD